MSVLDRVHAPGCAARTPYNPTHRVRAGTRTQCAGLHAVCFPLTACTAFSLNVQKFASCGWVAVVALACPLERTRNVVRCMQEKRNVDCS